MDITFWLFVTFCVTMAVVTWQAHRIGNERRDVALLGGIAALLGAGTAAAAVF